MWIWINLHEFQLILYDFFTNLNEFNCSIREDLILKVFISFSNFNVYSITIEENEVNVFSEYDLHYSFIEAIKNELLGKN